MTDIGYCIKLSKNYSWCAVGLNGELSDKGIKWDDFWLSSDMFRDYPEPQLKDSVIDIDVGYEELLDEEDLDSPLLNDKVIIKELARAFSDREKLEEAIKKAFEEYYDEENRWGSVESDWLYEAENYIREIGKRYGLDKEEIENLRREIIDYKYIDPAEENKIVNDYYEVEVEGIIRDIDIKGCAKDSETIPEFFECVFDDMVRDRITTGVILALEDIDRDGYTRGTCENIQDNWDELVEKYGEEVIKEINNAICVEKEF